MSPSQAKNAIRRALSAVVDPHPSPLQVHRIWAFFDSSCAYCGKALERGNRDAHIDHLVSSGAGGSNHFSNFVLSCGTCNGDEKRDQHWESFLRKKVSDIPTFDAGKNRIQQWMASCGTPSTVDPNVAQEIAAEIDAAVVAFEKTLLRIRELKNGAKPL